MPESIKVCPICTASNERSAVICWNCGASLANTPARADDTTAARRSQQSRGYAYRYGETDLYENELYSAGQRYLFGCFGLLGVIMSVGILLIAAPPLFYAMTGLFESTSSEPLPSPEVQIARPTVTPAPPTNTPTITVMPTNTPAPTSTREPCIQTVQSGDFLYDVVARCGHRSFDVFDLVVEINDLADAGTIFEGQVLEIPWPTNTPDPNGLPPAPADPAGETDAPVGSTPLGEINSGDSSVLELDDEELEEAFVIPTATLPPGVQFHQVTAGENIINIIAEYNASVEILSQLNPEVSFNQCDFGMTYGGERCAVMVFEGQRLRVPAPTPTPTLSPTPSGSETPTPTLTPTFNAPIGRSPADRAFFRRSELITLRWVPTGTLGEDETYRVIVEDRTAGIRYTADTIIPSFIIPEEWQGRGEDPSRHDYVWWISIVNVNNPDTPVFESGRYSFSWETLPE
ncbi:MAG: LysM peptidoglycan-binding domain-containing protein [Chloroflexota bacterium]